jgi:hypothetical protein
MAATVKKQMWLWATPDGVAPETGVRLIAASQGIFMPGAPCYVSQSGTVKLSDTSDGTGDVIHGFIVGVANRATAWPLTAELAANTEVVVQFIDIADTYAVYVETNDSDAAVTQAMIGDQYGLRVATGAGKIGYTTMDTNNANATVQVVNTIWNVETSKNAAADSPGIALVKFLAANVNASKA